MRTSAWIAVGIVVTLAGCDVAPKPGAAAAGTTPPVALLQPAAPSLPKAKFDPTRVALTGITITGTQHVAHLRLDRASSIDATIGDAVLEGQLIAIERDFIVVQADGARFRVSFAPMGPTADQSPKAQGPELGALARALPSDAGIPLPPMAQQAQAGTGNAAFLEAIGRASERERAK